MSKFWVEVKFNKDKNAECLIKASFQDFNPASSIVVRGMEGKVEIFFQTEQETAESEDSEQTEQENA